MQTRLHLHASMHPDLEIYGQRGGAVGPSVGGCSAIHGCTRKRCKEDLMSAVPENAIGLGLTSAGVIQPLSRYC
jgi:hypothetical protein